MGLCLPCCPAALLQIKGESVVRPYTPVTLDNEYGHFDLVGGRPSQNGRAQQQQHRP